MATSSQPKPLRFLYTKYAGQAAKGGTFPPPLEHGNGGAVSMQRKSDSLKDLQKIGKEIPKLERIHMFLADAYECPSLAFSSVGSASTNGRSCASRKDPLTTSPSRFRSKSQEFQSKYKLAASRSSPENMKRIPVQSGNTVGRNARFPIIQQHKTWNNNTNSTDCENKGGKLGEESSKSVLKVMIEDRKVSSNHRLCKPAEVMNFHLGDSGALLSNPKTKPSSLGGSRPSSTNKFGQIARVSAEEFQRCASRSTLDADRMDSSHYQYLLDDFASLTSSASLRSVKSDPASSQASARAQRPSTTGTVGTTQRLRDLCTCTTVTTPPNTLTGHRASFKSPDMQWPPRYAVIPSWPSYEDIQTLNSCGDHRGIMTRFYRKDLESKSNRRWRERGVRMSFWGQDPRMVHVVPSHTNTECAMCNLYKHNHNDSSNCPPNSPLVINGDRRSQQSATYSLKVNRSNVNTSHSSLTSSMRYIHSSSDQFRNPYANHARRVEIASTSSSRPRYDSNAHKDISYSWDTNCKLSYVQATG